MYFDHVQLVTKRFDRLTQWYIKNLGFEITREWAIQDLLPNFRIANLERGGVKLEIAGDGAMMKEAVFGTNIMEDQMIPGYRHIGIRVNNVDQIIYELTIKNIEIPFPPTNIHAAGIRTAFVHDCDRNIIEFVQPLDQIKFFC